MGPGRASPRERTLAGWAGMAGACCYSWYLAAPLFGTRLDPTRAYVSEFAVPGSPGSAWFRIADVAAGVLIILLAAGLQRSAVRPVDRRETVGAAAVAVVGLTAVVDGLHPMECAPSADPACRLAEQAQPLMGQLTDLHTLSGLAGVAAATTAMVTLSRPRAGDRPRRTGVRPGQVCAAALVLLAAVVSVLALTGADGVGVVEHLQLMLVAGWVAAVSAMLVGSRRSRREVMDRAR
ncbi:DUF998 domain-containing protein [Pseudonocardia sediminis]|uniref:DUF998 domain-containing protein n=1 Tax=Pseudonocardia sediminis TaxID=1397368 RepID=UPI0013EEEC13|nr:DUF998 domain-containing protein [Pseudonocardia sediminis]